MRSVAGSKLRFGLFLLLLLTAPVTLWLLARQGWKPSPEAFHALVASWGLLGPVLYIGLFVIRPLILFPSIFLFIAGGLAFGAVLGTLYALAGALLGACVAFGLARRLGREYVEAKLGGRFSAAVRGDWGPRVVFFLNLLPVAPVSLINYGAGLSGLPLRRFLPATALGLAPRIFAYCFFGSALLAGSRQLALASGLLGLLVLAPALWRRAAGRTGG